MKTVRPRYVHHIINIATIATTIALILTGIWMYHLGILSDLGKLQAYINGIGWRGALLFIVIQIVQVVIPIIPGGVSTAAGVILFGPWLGFIYNYLGIVIGSLINFWLARRFGMPVLTYLVSKKVYQKYIGYTKNQKRFDRFFTLAIVLPVAPDDILCLLAGLTTMSFKRFFWIIVLGKPLSIFAYSMALVYGAEWLVKLLGG